MSYCDIPLSYAFIPPLSIQILAFTPFFQRSVGTRILGQLAACTLALAILGAVIHKFHPTLPIPVSLISLTGVVPDYDSFIVMLLNVGVFALCYVGDWMLPKYLSGDDSTFARFGRSVVTPISEELIFRGILLPLLLPHFPALKACLICAGIFGLSHLSYILKTYIRVGRRRFRLATVLIETAFVVTYTTIFGFICATQFIWTGKLLAPIAAHSVANFGGMPSVGSYRELRPWKRVVAWVSLVVGVLGIVGISVAGIRAYEITL